MRWIWVILLIGCKKDMSIRHFSSQNFPSVISSFNATYDYGFYTDLSWDGIGTFDLQRAYSSDYSDATTIYTGTATSFRDDETVLDGSCYYRVRLNGGSWVNDSINSTISDGTTGNDIDIYGDSNTGGSGATPQSEGYAFKLTNPVGGNIVGLGGYTITPNPAYNVWDWTDSSLGRQLQAKSASKRLVIMAYGLNDCNSASSVTASDYGTAVSNFLAYANSIGWPYNRIIILGPFRGTQTTFASGGGTLTEQRRRDFRDAARAAADAVEAGFISVYDYQIDNSLVPPDGLHPDNAQHLLIAQWIGKRVGLTI